MQRVYDAADIIEASIVKGLLAQYEINVHISGYYLQGGVGEIPASGTTTLWVDDADVAEAHRVIEAYERG